MKISKLDIKYLVQMIFTWTFLNLALNMIGLFITKLLNRSEYSYMNSIKNEFVIPLVFQTVLFTICFAVAVLWIRNKKFVPYIFVAFQLVVFHIIFFLNMKINPVIHFETTYSNLGLRYLSNSGQYLIDILYLYFPIDGYFENGLFVPQNIGKFYVHWILLTLVYYFALTWISVKVSNFFFNSNPKIQAKPEVENGTEQKC